MKKILLSCAGGFSTSLLVNKMKDKAAENGKDYKIWAVAAETVPDVIKQEHPDCILIGPQISYMKDSLEKIANAEDIPLSVIGMQDYGTMNGENVLMQAEKIMD